MAKSKKAVEALIPKGISPSQIAAVSEAEFRRELLALTERAYKNSPTVQQMRNEEFLAREAKRDAVEAARKGVRVGVRRADSTGVTYGSEGYFKRRLAREVGAAEKAASFGGLAKGWWRKLPAWGRLGIKGAGGVLGGLGLLTTAMEIPDMLRTGRDVAEDLGFDPTGRRADAKTRLANEMNWRSRESDPLTVALLGQEQLNSDLTGLENFERADVPGPSDRSLALRDQALLRKLQIDHEEELEQLRGKAVRTDELEDAFHRLMGTR